MSNAMTPEERADVLVTEFERDACVEVQGRRRLIAAIATALREAEARGLERFLTEVKRICESDDFISYRMAAVENFVRAAIAQHDAIRAEKDRT